MSRQFLGGGGGKNNNRGKTGKGVIGQMVSGKRRRSQKEMIAEKTAHHVKDYNEMIEDLIDEKMFSTDPRKNSFHLPGTQAPEERKLTKGYLAAMEQAKQKRAKQRMKVRDKKVEITPKTFGDGEHGGRIDKKGRVINNQGKVLFQVDPKTGIITAGLGLKVGKYKAGSLVADHKMEKLIAKHSKGANVFNPFAAKPIKY